MMGRPFARAASSSGLPDFTAVEMTMLLGADQVDGVMTDEDAHALGAEAADVGAFLLVAALDGVALGEQNLGDGAHADAADADDVERACVAGYLHRVVYRPVIRCMAWTRASRRPGGCGRSGRGGPRKLLHQ